MAVIADELTQTPSGLTDAFVAMAARLRRATVQVRGRGPGGGSGVIWQPDGLIITNAHVARGPRASIELADGRTFTATVTARDERRDLAALTVDATDLPAATIGDSDALRVGSLVLAVGNPLGLTGALTTGVVHAAATADGPHGHDWVRADVRLAPGNSGGPLANAAGHVIGINSMIAGGLALAVPSNAVTRFLRGAAEPEEAEAA
jgi:serine protease Do